MSGPLALRFILQPAIAILYAFHDGIADARTGRPPYFWTIFKSPDERLGLLNEGWHAVIRVIIMAAAMDLVYQLMVFHSVNPVQLVVIVLLLAFVPYLLLRGTINRVAQKAMRERT